jgi:hypothetical protein
MAMKEVLPGIFHWTATHPKIRIEVSSYYLIESGVLIDPLVPRDGLEAFRRAPRHVLLTNRHHYRDSGRFAERYGCTVWCVESGLHEFTRGEAVKPFRPDDVLPGDVVAVEIGALCPDETALYIPWARAVALADGVVREGEGALSFVPNELMGDDPKGVKAGLREAYERLLRERDVDHLLLAHGWPWIGGGNRALKAFITRGR